MDHSEQINELAKALAEAQKSYKPVPKNKQAKVKSKRTGAEFSYNYADLADVLSMAIPCLSAQGLSFSQPHILMPDGKLRVRTLLMHSSGQWLMSDGIEISEGDDPQDFGAESTYFRRYDGCSLIGVAPDEDTDAQQSGRRVTGNQAMQMPKKPVEKPENPAQDVSATPEEEDSTQMKMDKAKELFTMADLANNGVNKDDLMGFLKRVGYKPETENGKPVSIWLAVVRQGLYQSVKSWLQTNKKAA